MELAELEERAEGFAARYALAVDLDFLIGFGTDGHVWATDRNSAIKVLESRECYLRERDCYSRLAERGITAVDRLVVPQMLHFDDELLVVEMEIVTPPYLLDFGKAYLDGDHPYSSEQLQAYHGSLGRHFRQDDIPRVLRICRMLRGYGIEYLDAKPKNIRLHSEEDEAALPDDDWDREIPEPPVDEDDQ